MILMSLLACLLVAVTPVCQEATWTWWNKP